MFVQRFTVEVIYLVATISPLLGQEYGEAPTIWHRIRTGWVILWKTTLRGTFILCLEYSLKFPQLSSKVANLNQAGWDFIKK